MQKVKCPSCEIETEYESMIDYNGKRMCEGCAENQDMFDNTDDPHGKNWSNL